MIWKKISLNCHFTPLIYRYILCSNLSILIWWFQAREALFYCTVISQIWSLGTKSRMMSENRLSDITNRMTVWIKSTFQFFIIKIVILHYGYDFAISNIRFCENSTWMLQYHQIMSTLWYHKTVFVIPLIQVYFVRGVRMEFLQD